MARNIEILHLELTLEVCSLCKESINPYREDIYYHFPTQTVVGGNCISKVRKEHNFDDYILIDD